MAFLTKGEKKKFFHRLLSPDNILTSETHHASCIMECSFILETCSSCSYYKWEFLPFVFLDVALLNFSSRVDLSGSVLQTDEIFPVSEMTKRSMFNAFGG